MSHQRFVFACQPVYLDPDIRIVQVVLQSLTIENKISAAIYPDISVPIWQSNCVDCDPAKHSSTLLGLKSLQFLLFLFLETSLESL